MELLLNLVWLTLASLAFCAFTRRRATSVWRSHASHRTALLALACTLILLFPVVSASDDLHPTQAVLEDATKRVQQMVAPFHVGSIGSSAPMILALLALFLLSALVVLQEWLPDAVEARSLSRSRDPLSGRSPPSL